MSLKEGLSGLSTAMGNISQLLWRCLLPSLKSALSVEGLPTNLEEYLDPSYKTLIILDDIMTSHGNDKRITDLFSKGSHHRNISVIYILQNFFYGAKETRNITLNAHYIILFRNPRDKSKVSSLAR
ncbi:hypothetical protein HOLleu_32028 [Holothuria leucospilota]|uniref:Uncharacterized protein n=1 Tax=Holothuria leucospilota TaxID=206669 RepID=A0A9Q0YUF9_HOLLE|nr:hypothetical protein HOLleu_32028 [Holothuria leucospilota]